MTQDGHLDLKILLYVFLQYLPLLTSHMTKIQICQWVEFWKPFFLLKNRS